MEAPKVSVTSHRAEGDPPMDYWRVEVSDARGVWTEAFGSEEALRAFLKGVQAGCSFCGVVHVPLPEIPRRL